ncbi:hypothetical protein ILYODFUR_006212 [Ilyodon furcidens]|uniref:Uncharacterized protein n=1 Tax=Ilyodon furcidens TaxID=33524 RepID=A0ABV0SLV3_9TELE
MTSGVRWVVKRFRLYLCEQLRFGRVYLLEPVWSGVLIGLVGLWVLGCLVPGVLPCASLALGLLLLCFADDLPLCRAYGCPGVAQCAGLPGATAAFWSWVHLFFAAHGCCVLQASYHSCH